MRKLNLFVLLLTLVTLFGCSEKLIESEVKSFKCFLFEKTDTLSQVELIKNYITYNDNKFIIHITKSEAMKLGIDNGIYDFLVGSIIDVNRDLDSLSKLNIKIGCDNIVNKPSIENIITTRNDYWTDSNGVPLPDSPIKVRLSLLPIKGQREDFIGPYKIVALAYVRSMGAWWYSLTDVLFSNNIRVSNAGFGPTSKAHPLMYPLVPNNGVCFWKIQTSGGAANNSDMFIDLKDDVKY